MKQQQRTRSKSRTPPLFQALFALLFSGVCASPEDGVVPLACPGIGDPPLLIDDWDIGGFVKLDIFVGKDVLCTLVEADVGIGLVTEGGTLSKHSSIPLTNNLDYAISNLKPVGRSYNGNKWEAAPGDFSSLVFDCSSSLYGIGEGGGNCVVMLPKPIKGRRYLLKSHDYGHELTPDDLTARFLEKATFGPTKADIEAFTSSEIWMAEQLAWSPTSHRQFFRERATDWHYHTSQSGLLHAGPCERGSRYRNFALTPMDVLEYLHVRQSPLDKTKLILSVGGHVRTVVDGPMKVAFGWWKEEDIEKIDIDEIGMSFQIQSPRPSDGVGGIFSLNIPLQNGGKTTKAALNIFFGDESGNPRVQFDEAHAATLENLMVLPNYRYEEVTSQHFFEENTEVLQLTSDIINSTSCIELDKELVGFTYPPKATIARTTKIGETRYWIHSPMFNFLSNELDAPLADGGKEAVDRTRNPPSDLAQEIRKILKTKCSNVPRTFLNEDSCKLADRDACPYDQTADIDKTTGGKVLVCGSPGEAASRHDIYSGTHGRGGFAVAIGVARTKNAVNLKEQRRNVWAEIALHSKDQLRQKMAYALSQILVIDEDSGMNDATENFVNYYDIFVRNAFGNYFDILKEVTRHPMMARMLTYIDGQSTGYNYIKEGHIQQADENYAREVMQLFSIGLALQNDDGTLKLDNDGNKIATYTNFDISEYAKVYVGLRDQAARGNIETRLNEVDPLRIETSWKDQFPKLGLDSKFIGDGYPLCSNLPHQHFLKKGAKYRILGAKANPDFASEAWSGGASPKRASLDFVSSNLTSIICNKNEVGVCNPQNIVILPTDIECFGIECEIEEPRTIEIAEGLWYEYIRPPCVNQAFYNNGKSVYRLSGKDGFKQILCGNPSLRDASTICCKKTEQGMRDATGRKEVFGGERTTFEAAVERCIEDDLGICDSFLANKRTLCTVEQDACDLDNVFYWLSAPCSMNAKVSPEGNVAIVHQPSAATGDKENETFAQVSNDTKSFFRTDWRASDAFPNIGNFLDDFDTNCASIVGCFVEDTDGNCQCKVFVEEGIAFDDDSELSSVGTLLSIATFGSFVSDSTSFVSTGISGIKKFPSGPLSINTIFEATDSIGRIHYRTNVLSIVKLGDGSLQMRNPVTFWSLPDATIRDGEYELDAALEHYFFHPNVPSFLAKLLAQRFGSSNPSPRYTKVIAHAFKTGKYGNFGSNEYGCLEATIAAIILDREAQDHILDADPIQGQLQGPYMQLMKAMRASEYKSDRDNPIIRFRGEIFDNIGEEPHKMPSVFSFFEPSYVAPGRVGAANMFAPEAGVLTGSTSMATAIGLMSLFKYGSSRCDYSFFGTRAPTKMRPNNVCVIGDDSTNFGNNEYNPADYGLDDTSADDVVNDLATLMTSGRLSPENRQIIKEAFTETLFNGVTDDLVREALINAQQLVTLSPEFHSNSLSRKRNKNREPPEPKEARGIPYKAVIQVVLSGGLDSFNVLVPESCTGTNEEGMTVDDQYLEVRGALAFDRSEGEFDLKISPNTEQPCERFAIHEELPYIKELYDDKDLLFFANVGVVNENNMNRDNWDAKTKSMLFAHNTMLKEIKKIDPYDSSAGSGILGRLNDLLTTKFNGAVNAIGIVENSIALAGNPAFGVPVTIVGQDGPYEYGNVEMDEMWFDIETKTAEINSEHDAFSGIFGDTWSEALMNGINDGDRLTKFFSNEESVGLDADIWARVAGEDNTSRSFQTLSKLIQTRTDRKVDRDTFTIEVKGFDHHQDMKASLKEKLVEVNRNIKRLIEQLKKDRMWDQVTIVVASEFGRSLSPNSGAGADHGWGGNYMVMGGSIDGGRVLGKYPDDFTSKSRLNASRNTRTRFIPTMSWEHIYNGVVGWMADGFNEGLTEDDLNYVLPNKNNCIDPVEGEGSVPLFTAADLYIGARTDTDSNVDTNTDTDTDSNIEPDPNTNSSTVLDIESSAHESSTRRTLTLMVFSCIGFFYCFV